VRAQRPVNGQDLSTVPAGDGSAADPLYDQAVDVVRTNQRASISLVQRHLRIGYNRAERLLDAMADAGQISKQTSNDFRQIISSAETA
jgi:DNA segregation ATPase FtsK/SpoIIIE-like protein